MKTFTLAAAVHKLVAPEIQLDREIAERVGQEILRDQLEPGAWATALAASGGEKQDALAVYARIRIRKLSAERRTRQAKSRSFEARRLTTCLGIKTVQDLLDRGPADRVLAHGAPPDVDEGQAAPGQGLPEAVGGAPDGVTLWHGQRSRSVAGAGRGGWRGSRRR